jgi:hypothetical protein
VASTWSVAIDRLEREAPNAITLLRLLACYAPEQIPIDDLIAVSSTKLPATVPETEHVVRLIRRLADEALHLDDGIGALGRYSLISRRIRGRISVHRLVQAVSPDTLPADQRAAWQAAAAVLLTALLPANPRDRANWDTFQGLLAHARAALPEDSSGLQLVVNYLGASGDYRTARAVQDRITTCLRDSYGAEHPKTLTSRGSLAFWTGQAGDAEGACDLFAELVPLRERVSGPEHPETLNARSSLTHWTEVAMRRMD